MTKDEDCHDSIKERMVDWFVDKVLAKAVVAVLAASLSLIVWQVVVDFTIEDHQEDIDKLEAKVHGPGGEGGLVGWRIGVDIKMEARQKELEVCQRETAKIYKTMNEMQLRMDKAMETGPAGHMTHREHLIHHAKD